MRDPLDNSTVLGVATAGSAIVAAWALIVTISLCASACEPTPSPEPPDGDSQPPPRPEAITDVVVEGECDASMRLVVSIGGLPIPVAGRIKSRSALGEPTTGVAIFRAAGYEAACALDTSAEPAAQCTHGPARQRVPDLPDH